MLEFVFNTRTKFMLNHGNNLYRLRTAILQDCKTIMLAYNDSNETSDNNNCWLNAQHVKEDIEWHRKGAVIMWMTRFVNNEFYIYEPTHEEYNEEYKKFKFSNTKAVFENIMRFDMEDTKMNIE